MTICMLLLALTISLCFDFRSGRTTATERVLVRTHLVTNLTLSHQYAASAKFDDCIECQKVTKLTTKIFDSTLYSRRQRMEDVLNPPNPRMCRTEISLTQNIHSMKSFTFLGPFPQVEVASGVDSSWIMRAKSMISSFIGSNVNHEKERHKKIMRKSFPFLSKSAPCVECGQTKKKLVIKWKDYSTSKQFMNLVYGSHTSRKLNLQHKKCMVPSITNDMAPPMGNVNVHNVFDKPMNISATNRTTEKGDDMLPEFIGVFVFCDDICRKNWYMKISRLLALKCWQSSWRTISDVYSDAARDSWFKKFLLWMKLESFPVKRKKVVVDEVYPLEHVLHCNDACRESWYAKVLRLLRLKCIYRDAIQLAKYEVDSEKSRRYYWFWSLLQQKQSLNKDEHLDQLMDIRYRQWMLMLRLMSVNPLYVPASRVCKDIFKETWHQWFLMLFRFTCASSELFVDHSHKYSDRELSYWKVSTVLRLVCRNPWVEVDIHANSELQPSQLVNMTTISTHVNMTRFSIHQRYFKEPFVYTPAHAVHQRYWIWSKKLGGDVGDVPILIPVFMGLLLWLFGTKFMVTHVSSKTTLPSFKLPKTKLCPAKNWVRAMSYEEGIESHTGQTHSITYSCNEDSTVMGHIDCSILGKKVKFNSASMIQIDAKSASNYEQHQFSGNVTSVRVEDKGESLDTTDTIERLHSNGKDEVSWEYSCKSTPCSIQGSDISVITQLVTDIYGMQTLWGMLISQLNANKLVWEGMESELVGHGRTNTQSQKEYDELVWSLGNNVRSRQFAIHKFQCSIELLREHVEDEQETLETEGSNINRVLNVSLNSLDKEINRESNLGFCHSDIQCEKQCRGDNDNEVRSSGFSFIRHKIAQSSLNSFVTNRCSQNSQILSECTLPEVLTSVRNNELAFYQIEFELARGFLKLWKLSRNSKHIKEHDDCRNIDAPSCLALYPKRQRDLVYYSKMVTNTRLAALECLLRSSYGDDTSSKLIQSTSSHMIRSKRLLDEVHSQLYQMDAFTYATFIMKKITEGLHMQTSSKDFQYSVSEHGSEEENNVNIATSCAHDGGSMLQCFSKLSATDATARHISSPAYDSQLQQNGIGKEVRLIASHPTAIVNEPETEMPSKQPTIKALDPPAAVIVARRKLELELVVAVVEIAPNIPSMQIM